MFNLTNFLSHILLFTTPNKIPIDVSDGTISTPTVYAAWARPLIPSSGKQQEATRGLDQPFRQNGSWIDVGVWVTRKEVISQPPFLFTLAPGRDSNTHTVTQWHSGNSVPNKKLAYSEGDSSLPVNYGSLSAFLLTDEGNTNTQLVDDWTVSKDKYGRTVLGLQKVSSGRGLRPLGEGTWTMQSCAWNVADLKACDGFYFMSCSGCYGTESVIEILEYKGTKALGT